MAAVTAAVVLHLDSWQRASGRPDSAYLLCPLVLMCSSPGSAKQSFSQRSTSKSRSKASQAASMLRWGCPFQCFWPVWVHIRDNHRRSFARTIFVMFQLCIFPSFLFLAGDLGIRALLVLCKGSILSRHGLFTCRSCWVQWQPADKRNHYLTYSLHEAICECDIVLICIMLHVEISITSDFWQNTSHQLIV